MIGRRLAAGVIAAAWLAAGHGALAQGAAPPNREPPPVAPASMPASEKPFVAAIAAWIAKLDEARGADLPKADDPVVRRTLTEAQALTRTLGTPAAPADDLNNLDPLCTSATRVMIAYTFAGLKGQANSQTPAAEAAAIIQKVQAQNSRNYFGMLFPLQIFDQHCTAAFTPAMDAFASHLTPAQLTPIRLEGLNGVRRGGQEMLREALALALDPGITAKGRGIIVSQLEVDVDNLALVMPTEERAKVAAWLAQVSAKAPPDVQPRIRALSARVTSARCAALCKL